MTSLPIALALSLVAAAPLAADVVERRGTEAPVEGEVSRVDDGGVTVRVDGTEQFVPWDRVRDLRAAGADPMLSDRLATATELWRARTRVERGDTALAEPLLERLFERYRGATHETARVVAEGLLRCRLARGANAYAVIPALEVARLERAGVATRSYVDLPPVLDPVTSLCPQLPPTFVESRALPGVARDLASYAAPGDPIVSAIAVLYERALWQHLALEDPGPAPAPISAEHDGVTLMRAVVGCADRDPSRREAARESALEVARDRPPWIEAWTRYAVGLSLLHGPGTGRRQRGLVQLLHVPARFDAELPYLAGLALAVAGEASRADGDETTAAIVLEELDRAFPSHPVRTSSGTVRLPPREDPS